jgi:hypothetical protein
MNKPPAIPANESLERALLGAIITGGRDIIDRIGRHEFYPSLFFSPPNQTIFNATVTLYDENAPINLVTVSNRLEELGVIESVGGRANITQIQMTELCPSVDTAAYYLEQLRELKVRRDAIAIGHKLISGDLAPETALSLLEGAVIGSGRNGESDFTIKTGREVFSMTLDEHDCLLGDRLLSKGGKLVIAGAAGIGKSRLLLQLAAASITGRDWCGIETHAKKLRWLILQTENSNRRLQFELRALAKEYGEEFLDYFHIHTLESDKDGFVSLESEEVCRKIATAIRITQPDIVGNDPLRDFAIGNLDKDADMTATCTALRELCQHGNHERAIVAVHHAGTGKAGALRATGYERAGFARNSKALLGWARAQINIAPGSPDNNDLLVMASAKNNDGKEFEKFAVRLDPHKMIYVPEPGFDFEEWQAEISTGNTKRRFTEDDLLKVMDGKQWDKRRLVKAFMDETGAGRSKAYDLIASADKKRLIKLNKLTKIYEQA